MQLSTLSPRLAQRLRRIGEFLAMGFALFLVNQAHDALNTGAVQVPVAWAPFVPLGVTATSLVIAALTPQLLELRHAALGPASAPAPSAEEIGSAVASALAASAPALVSAVLPAALPAQPAPAPIAPPATASAQPEPTST